MAPIEPPREGGGPNPPFGEGFFQRVVNVHWRKAGIAPGRFSFVTGDSSDTTSWGMSAFSDNGIDWYGINDFIQFTIPGSSDPGVTLLSSIMRAGSDAPGGEVVLAVGYHPYPVPPHPGIWELKVPIVLRATPGDVWTDTHVPLFDPIANDPAVGTYLSEARWVGYNKAGNKFYLTVNYIENVYSGGTYVLTRSRIFTYTFDADTSTWTEIDVYVAPYFDGTLNFPVGTMVSSQDFAKGAELIWCNSARTPTQVIHTGGHSIAAYGDDALLIDGVITAQPEEMNSLWSVAALGDTICIGGFAVDNSSLVFVSADLGATWNTIPALQDLYKRHSGYGKGLTPVFTCSLLV